MKGMGSGAAARVWQEQTNHKLVRHSVSDPKRYCKKAAVGATARCNLGCCPGDVKEDDTEEVVDPIYVRWYCSAAVSRRDWT